jgi:hypothetical protein
LAIISYAGATRSRRVFDMPRADVAESDDEIVD